MFKGDYLLKELFEKYPDVVTPEQVAEMLQIGLILTYRLLRNGMLPSKRVGKKYIIAKQTVIEFVLTERVS